MRNEMKDSRMFFRFDHPNDISIGRARIVYEKDVLKYEGKHPAHQGHVFLEGWVLPGGIRTRDRELAEEAARNIDKMITKQIKAEQAAIRRG